MFTFQNRYSVTDIDIKINKIIIEIVICNIFSYISHFVLVFILCVDKICLGQEFANEYKFGTTYFLN